MAAMSGHRPDECSPSPSGDHPAFTDKPTVLELKKLLSELKEWRKFGVHLPGITSRMINTLGRYGDQSIGSRKDALFTAWLRVYKKASWDDVITALHKSGEITLSTRVANDVKRSYTRQHGLHTTESSQGTTDIEQTTMTDDVPAATINDDELKRDAKRAITRNIDKLTDVISSSEITLHDIALGCAAKELIPTSFKNYLLDPLTGRSTRTRTAELLNHVETWVGINKTHLDVFLIILTAKCGETGKEIARNVAKEYGHELPQYEASKSVIGTKGGAVSNSDTADTTDGSREITLISESQVKEVIKSLHQTFASVVRNIRFNLESSGKVHEIAVHVEEFLRLKNLANQVMTIDELFNKIQPHYSFLDCELLEEIVNAFLSAKVEIQTELSQYMNKVKEFKKSSRLRHIKTAIEEAFSLIPKQDVTDSITCRVVIKLHEIWGSITLKRFHDVLKYLFSTQKKILAHIHIEGGSISISFIAPLSQSQYLIDKVLSKKNFLQRIGIIEVSINDQSILSAGVDSLNVNQSLLDTSEEGDQLGVSILLVLRANVDYMNGEGKTPLMLACSDGHEHVVQTLLSANAGVNKQDRRGYTALMRAVESQSIKIVTSLLKHNADPNKVTLDGNTALILACTSYQTDIVKLLLSCNADLSPDVLNELEVSTRTDNHHNILLQLIPYATRNVLAAALALFAIKYGQPKIITTLLQCIDPKITDEQLHLSVSCCNGNYISAQRLLHHPNVDLKYFLLPPINIASSCGHLPIVELLLTQNIFINIKSEGFYTPLMYASLNGHLQVVELLLEKKANINIQNCGTTALILASQNGHYQVVKLLLNKHADVNICTNEGYTALIFASHNGHHQVVELLLNNHADVNIHANGCTALIFASQNGHHQVVELLLNKHADVNIHDNDGYTALMLASQNGHHQVVELLLNKHADVNIRDNKGHTALTFASQNGHHQVVELLFNKHADVNIHDNEGYTALILASQNGHHQVVELLFNKHADVNIRDNEGYTALILASQNGHHQVVELLLNKHADVNIYNNDGGTALMLASQDGHHQVVELLLNKNADVNIHNNDGCTALMLASQDGHHQVVELLLNKHADVKICANNGCTALIIASQNGHHQVVEQLLDKHADVNIRTNNNGCTALILASQNDHHQVVELLLNKHADVNIRNNDGGTALILASQNGHHQVVEQLLNKHADVNIRDNDGGTALMFACTQNCKEVVKLLIKEDIDGDDKWLSLVVAKYGGHKELVQLMLDEFDNVLSS